MQKNSIGIIGNGFVGNAVYQNVKDKFLTYVYDKDISKSPHSYEEVLTCEFIFICLPTPMIDHKGGPCNLSIVENFFKSLPQNLDNIFILKSTVPIGTTSKIQNLRKDLKIIHNPEFLTANNAANDFKNSERNVIGGKDLEVCNKVNELYKTILPGVLTYIVKSEESEAIKYFSNIFLATKVTYFNLVNDLCNKFNLNYESVISGVTSDSRIGTSHTKVPGPDGDRGFGGTCFPKDINALIQTFEENNLNSKIFKQIWKYNKKVRKNWDWKHSKSAVLKEN